MSQADTTLTPGTDQDKDGGAIAEAMAEAIVRKAAARAPSPRAAAAGTSPRQPVTAGAGRTPATLEAVRRIAPNTALAENIGRAFGLDVPCCETIADATEEAVGRAARELEGTLSERAMALHLGRVVGAHVGSAHGAAVFYSNKVSDARALTSKLANDARDEDRHGERGRDGGFDDKAERARQFAAQVGMQAYALLAAAEGAVSAYAAVTGEEWKPYEPDRPASQGVARRGAAEQMAAFG